MIHYNIYVQALCVSMKEDDNSCYNITINPLKTSSKMYTLQVKQMVLFLQLAKKFYRNDDFSPSSYNNVGRKVER